MWGKPRKKAGSKAFPGRLSDVTTLVAVGTDVFGNVSFSGNIHIEGRIVGDVMAESGVLFLAESGEIEGDVRAPKVIINGTVRGNVYAMEHLELTSKAEISGNVYYNLIEMGVGAQVNGHLKHTPGGELFPARPALAAVSSDSNPAIVGSQEINEEVKSAAVVAVKS